MEFLKEVLGDLYDQVAEKMKGSKIKLADLSTGNYVDKNKFDAQAATLSELQGQIKTANEKIQEFTKMDIDKIKTEAEEYKTKYETAKTDFDKKLADIEFNDSLEKLLVSDKYNVKDVVALKAHLDMSKISKDGDNFIGLDEQIKPLTEPKSYLFNQADTTPPPTFTHGNSGGGTAGADNGIKFNFTGVRPIPKE